MRVPHALVAIAALSALILIACSDGGDDPDATSTLQPPTTLVLVRGDDLSVAALDGLTPPRAITSGSFGAQYAGFAPGTDGGTDLYYVEQLAEDDATGSPIDAALYRIDLEGGVPEELFAFESHRLSSLGSSSASVSPDGRYVLLMDADGIVLLELGSSMARRLLTNSPPCEGPIDCFRYGWPRWSPDGKLARIGKGFWEGGSDKIIDPFVEVVEEQDVPGGASFTPRWSPDGERLCVSENTYSSAGAALVYDLSTGEVVDSTLDIPLPTPVEEGRLRIDTRGCVWSPSEGLAISFNVPDNYIYGAIAIVDSSFKLLHQSDLIENLADVVDWLPDGSGVVYNRWNAQGGGARQPGIYYPERGLIELAIEADAVLAVIP